MSSARSGLSETDRDDVPWGRAPVAGIPIPPFADAAEHRTYLRALQTFLLLLDRGEPSAATIALAAALEAELPRTSGFGAGFSSTFASAFASIFAFPSATAAFAALT